LQLVVQFVITWYMIEHGVVLRTAVVGGGARKSGIHKNNTVAAKHPQSEN
jgi:hypothetical protein